jgi:hypothetical protein
MKAITNVALLLSLSACSSIIEGTSQELMINTNPAGADCALMRQGNSIARVDPTPGAATIKKTKYDITIVCNKDGYQEATFLNHSGAAGATVGNIVLGGGIGWAIDSASGADNKYDSPVNITMVPEEHVVSASKHSRHKHQTVAVDTEETKQPESQENASPQWPSQKH